MPSAVLNNFAEQSGKSVDTLERYWNEAKDAARSKGLAEDSPEYFSYAIAVIKNRAGVSESLQEFSNWIVEIALDETYNLQEADGPVADAEADADLGLGGLPPLGRAPAAPGQPGSGDDAEDLPPQNIKGETLIQQYARKKGKTEYEIEQIWLRIKDKARIWQAGENADDKEMLEYAVRIFQETMEIIPDAPPPEAIAQQAAIAQATAGNTGALTGGNNTEKGPDEEKKSEVPAEKKEIPPAEKKADVPGEEEKELSPEEKKKKEEEDKKKKEESKKKTEAAIEIAMNNRLSETFGIKAAANTISAATMRKLRGLGLKKKDLSALNKDQVSKLVKKVEKVNKTAASNTKKAKGFSFLGNTILGLGAFAGGFVAGKALDKAFQSIFAVGKKSINPNFGGSDF